MHRLISQKQGRSTLEDLKKYESLSRTHITFSLTLDCPLRCDHCIVDAGSHREHTTMPINDAIRYASQMRELYDHGIRVISFTGGEPLLAYKQMKIISEAASKADILCGVVTSAYWAYDTERAEKLIRSLPNLLSWDISYDVFHAKYVNKKNIYAAYKTLKSLDRLVSIRYSYNNLLDFEDMELLNFLSSFIEEKDFNGQKMRSYGRYKEKGDPKIRKPNIFMMPCLTQGMLVRYDGSIGPCCSNLAESRNHPFNFGNARIHDLVEIHKNYLTDPLLQLLRVIGFSEIKEWLREGAQFKESMICGDICDFCHKIFEDTKRGKYLLEKASVPETKLKIAIIASRTLEEHDMLRRTIQEIMDRDGTIPDFPLALTIAEELEKKSDK